MTTFGQQTFAPPGWCWQRVIPLRPGAIAVHELADDFFGDSLLVARRRVIGVSGPVRAVMQGNPDG